ncbi:MAG: DNA replication/repair protein RecF [Chloroflexota bacterium]
MVIKHLSLTGFRNYSRLELDLSAGTTIIYGDNAQGKTNLLESIYYLATTRSPYSDSDQQIINWELNAPEEPIVVSRLVVIVEYQNESQKGSGVDTKTIELRLIQERRNGSTTFRREAVIDRKKVRLMDLLGHLRVVLFLPSDLELITGNPSARRRYMDITLCQTDSIYCQTLSGYNKILDQRNAALKSVAETGRGREVINILSERLAQKAAEIFAKRAGFLSSLAKITAEVHYAQLTSSKEMSTLNYLPRFTPKTNGRGNQGQPTEMLENAEWLLSNKDDRNLIAKRFEEILQLTLERDIGAGNTGVGPHRDDWHFLVNGRSLAKFGSRGQQRTAMLALKIAEIQRIHQETGETPVLLLDEVASELDGKRRQLLLLQISRSGQALVTTTDLEFFPDSFLEKCTTLHVKNGYIASSAT